MRSMKQKIRVEIVSRYSIKDEVKPLAAASTEERFIV